LINSEVIAETIRDLIQCKDINTGLLPQSVVEERERFSHDSTDKEISNTKHEAQCDDMNNAYNGYCLITGKEGVERDWEEGFEILVEMASQKSNDRTRGKPYLFMFYWSCITFAQLILHSIHK